MANSSLARHPIPGGGPHQGAPLGLADARLRWETAGFAPGVVSTMMEAWALSTQACYFPNGEVVS